MILLIVVICFSFTNILAIQPLEDGLGHNLPLLPLTTDPSKPGQEENRKKEEEFKLKAKVESQKKEDELKKHSLMKDKDISPVNSPSNSTISESVDPIGWLFNYLGYTNNNTNTSQHTYSDSKTVGINETNGDKKTVLGKKLSDTEIEVAQENESFPKTGRKKHLSVGEQASAVVTPSRDTVVSNSENMDTTEADKKNQNSSVVVVKSEPASSCNLTSYGSVCTYVLLTSSSLYFHHVLQSF